MAGVDTNRGAKRAREARRALAGDFSAPLADLLDTVEGAAGLSVVVAALPGGVAGACFREGEDAVLWVNGSQVLPRQRFTLAHELAHAWCRHDGVLAVDSVETLSGATTNALEIQANAFAAEFLVPGDAVRALVRTEPSLEEVVRIAAAYGVSAIVVVYRLQRLELASAPRLERLKAEVADGLHERLAGELDLPLLDDHLSRIADLPYLSPRLAGTRLAASLRDGAADPSLRAAVERLAL